MPSRHEPEWGLECAACPMSRHMWVWTIVFAALRGILHIGRREPCFIYCIQRIIAETRRSYSRMGAIRFRMCLCHIGTRQWRLCSTFVEQDESPPPINGSAIRRGALRLGFPRPKTYHCPLSSSQQLPSPVNTTRPRLSNSIQTGLTNTNQTPPALAPHRRRSFDSPVIVRRSSPSIHNPNRDDQPRHLPCTPKNLLQPPSYDAHHHHVPYDQLPRFFILHVHAEPSRMYRTDPRNMGHVQHALATRLYIFLCSHRPP